jgi:outer membrane protein assembly factor BamB
MVGPLWLHADDSAVDPAAAAAQNGPLLGSVEFRPTPRRPIGWRGDGTGRFPAANPPMRWGRTIKGFYADLQCHAGKPQGPAKAGEPLNMGFLRDWVILGPFPTKDFQTGIDEEILTGTDETRLGPQAGDRSAGKVWTHWHISVENQSKSDGKLFLDFARAVGPDGMQADRSEVLNRKIKDKCDLEAAIQQAMGKADRKTYNAWSNDADSSKYTPTSDGKRVWAAFWGGNKGVGANVVVCFDLEGKRMWSRFCGQTEIAEHGTHSSPALCGDYLVFKSGAALFGFDKATGKVAWRQEIEGGIGASVLPLWIGKEIVAYVPQAGLFRPADGAQLWKAEVTTDIFVRDDQGQTLVLAPGPHYRELAKNLLVEYSPEGTQPEARGNFFFEGPRIYFRTRAFMYCIGEE